jgi:hypothetical protein
MYLTEGQAYTLGTKAAAEYCDGVEFRNRTKGQDEEELWESIRSFDTQSLECWGVEAPYQDAQLKNAWRNGFFDGLREAIFAIQDSRSMI